MGTISYTVPQAGTDLNSIADPEIATALNTIKTLVNGNIDTNNLSPTAAITNSQLTPGAGRTALVAKTAAYAANSGDLVLAGVTGAPLTVTLPAPSLNALVGIVAGASATGANPITVARHSADVINGVGLSSATSFLLGTPGAYAVLQSDGTNWFTIAGGQDTGWVALGLGTGVSASSGSASARLVGNVVTLASTLTTSTQVNGGSTLFTVPASMKPASAPLLNPSAHTASAAALSMPYPIRISASTGAAAAEYPTGDGAFGVGYKLGLDGLTYPIS